jgi:hypothetical protein
MKQNSGDTKEADGGLTPQIRRIIEALARDTVAREDRDKSEPAPALLPIVAAQAVRARIKRSQKNRGSKVKNKLGDRLIRAARDGRAIARGEADPASYRVRRFRGT